MNIAIASGKGCIGKTTLAEKNIMEFEDSPAAREISNIWDKVNQLIKP